MTTTGIILAAGKGTRMRSNTPKSLHNVAGLTLVGHGIRTMRAAGIDDVIVVASQELADSPVFQDALASSSPPVVKVVIQTEQRGTADALNAARSAASDASTLVVAPVDMVLVTHEIAREMLQVHFDSDAAVTVLGARVDDPAGLGRIKLGPTGRPVSVVEEHEADVQLLQNNLINTAWYCFDNSWIWDELDSILNHLDPQRQNPRSVFRRNETSRSTSGTPPSSSSTRASAGSRRSFDWKMR